MSFFVRKKERRNESEENGTDWRLRGSLQRGNIKKQREENMITVEWEEANMLEIGELLEMAKDGYCFCVSDGKIRSIGVMVSQPF